MQKVEFDYSELAEAAPDTLDTWEPPRHVFFGRKIPETGRMEKEPVYAHKPYPALLYLMENGKMRARQVNNEAEMQRATIAGFKTSPESFGVLTAPSREQILEAEEAERVKAEELAALAKIKPQTIGANSLRQARSEVAA